jgi:hypothetical protein
VKKMKSNGSFKSPVFVSLPPGTAVTAPGSKYFGTSSRRTGCRGGAVTRVATFRLRACPV